MRKKLQNNEKCNTVIDMTVKNDDDFLSVFSSGEAPVISSAVADFLENSVENMYPTQKVELHIHSDCIDSLEEEVYRKAIHKYYDEKYEYNRKRLWYNKMLTLILGGIGVIILAIAVYLGYHFNNPVWAEVIDIVAWVFVWEAVDIGVFQNHSLRINRRRYLVLSTANVVYLPIEPKKSNENRKG
jgi:hypothetical protein